MALFGTRETIRAQARKADVLTATFAYLDDVFRPDSAVAARIAAIAPGETQRHELAGGAFALEQAYLTKTRAEGFFESHRKYVDVQVIVAGEEWMEVADLGRCVVKRPYLEERDLIVYEDVTGASLLRFGAGDAAIFYPADVHMPGMGRERPGGLVRKTVIKVPVSGL